MPSVIQLLNADLAQPGKICIVLWTENIDYNLLRGHMIQKIPYGTKIPVTLTFHERDIIRDETFCDPDFARVAAVEGKRIKILLSLDEIEEIQGYIAAAANHSENRKLQKELDRLFEKFQVLLDTYDDQDDME